MMKMETKKIAATFAILMIALGLAGLAYAHWSETLYIEGTVETGNLDVEWSIDDFGDNEVEKDVGIVDVTIDGDTLYIMITNAYPCYAFNIVLDVHSVGSVPAKFVDYEVTSLEDPDSIQSFLDLAVRCEGLDQIEFCQEGYIYIDGHFNQNNEAAETLPENAKATFAVELEFANWNAIFE